MQKMNNSISGTVGATVTARTVIRVSFCSLFSSSFFSWHFPLLRNLYEKLRRSAHQEFLFFNERLDTLLSNNENLCRKTRGIRRTLGFWWRYWIPLYFINRFTEIIVFFIQIYLQFLNWERIYYKKIESLHAWNLEGGAPPKSHAYKLSIFLKWIFSEFKNCGLAYTQMFVNSANT